LLNIRSFSNILFFSNLELNDFSAGEEKKLKIYKKHLIFQNRFSIAKMLGAVPLR